MRTLFLGPMLPVILTAACGMGDSFIEFDRTPPSTLGDGAYRYGATIDGELTWWVVSFADVEKTPDWSPGDIPPLSVSQAVLIAGREIERYTNTPGAYRLEQVEWLHLGNYMNSHHKWIYLVTYERRCEYRGQTFEGRGTIRIPVLLDGTAIQGTKERAGG